ncbi:archease [Candidatus Woesearchaeota archaeon]|nr:archease [Candidatus Woesearchaeota archaeon]
MKYKFLDHTADVMFEAYGKTLDELFENCAMATEETMINLKKVKPKVRKIINLKDKEIENLLFNFLSELIYYKDAQLLVFSKFKVSIKKGKTFTLIAVIQGEKLNNYHEEKVDIKAVTYHKFQIKKLKNNFVARIILDI